MSLLEKGFSIVPSIVSDAMVYDLREALFELDRAGERCLLDHPLVQQAAFQARGNLCSKNYLNQNSIAIQAITFDKTPTINWKVAWHQDLMFPFANKVASNDFDLSCQKDGIEFARPPLSVLNKMLAVRVHLDDCDETNGPLRVSPGTHRFGILPSADIPTKIRTQGEMICLAKKGEALLMNPLILHASSQATAPKHRRILHFVYYTGPEISENWHRNI